MALEEITFVNTNGDEINLSNIVNQMINFYLLKQEVGESQLTDFNEGSVIRNLLEAFAIPIYAYLEEQHEATQIAFISTSYGVWLDRIGEMPFINMPRITGDYAKGDVTFTLEEAQSDDFVIPADTIVACSDTGLDFATTEDCTISVGETTGTVGVECLTIGEDGNVTAGSIDTVMSDTLNTELLSVSNSSALSLGVDDEDDEEYRARLLENIRADGFGTVGWYVNLCEGVNGVHDVALVDATGYTKKALINGDIKPTPDTVLLEVLTILSDISKKVLNHSFTVDKPAYTTVNLAITLSVTTEISTTKLTSTITNYFNGGESNSEMDYEGVNINQSVTREDLVTALSLVDEIVDVTSITSGGNEITTLSPATNGVLKLGTVSFTQNEV